jgi:hypothetical protein
MECRKEENLTRCPCTSTTCVRRGTCCQCLAAHLASQSLPRCCFPPEPEKARDRSFQGFAKAWNV